MEITMKQTLTFMFGRRPQNCLNFFFCILSFEFIINVYTKNQLSSLLSYGDSYEEDLKFMFGRRPQKATNQ